MNKHTHMRGATAPQHVRVFISRCLKLLWLYYPLVAGILYAVNYSNLPKWFAYLYVGSVFLYVNLRNRLQPRGRK